MNDQLRLYYDSKAKDLRAHLKRWENEWATAHGGSKPGRQDIKENPDIAEKYKEYNRVRETLAGKLPPPPPSPQDREFRRSKRPAQPLPLPSETPLKRIKHSEASGDEKPMNTPPISRKLFSPAKVTSLGPTPQKDGRVLGLFDLLVERELTTPSKWVNDMNKTPSKRGDVQATPSKRTATTDNELGRTPTSASKRRCLMTTPRRYRGEMNVGVTPTSKSKPHFDTPAFLRRHALPVVDEATELDAPAPLKLPRKPMVRGLSEIVASLRRAEEEALDDELEALREAENDQGGPDAPPPAETGSQPQHPVRGGFNDGAVVGTKTLNRNEKPMTMYKKKAPKRTTRQVKMKPMRTKRPVDLNLANDGVEEDEVEAGKRVSKSEGAHPADTGESDAGFEDGNGDGGGGEKKAKKESRMKKTVRKVNELAHANFQRLKLRSGGAKGGPGYNSRFRRKR
ncbi:hypothetical protein XA68_14202 [Ophiocordyceps unilateralis]|uniref:DNA replication regulator SLD2 n=1 Tax=Ophiocordyceps unilateralis TaxID=268505 RepID=A0A2A9PB07_OPHUN|nr:hypothetical protein XA68_14202 [Ophiocordyceps unilateralis]